MPFGHLYASLGDMTPEFVVSARYGVSVSCGRCRLIREVDALALATARPKQRLQDIRFRCSTCGEPGEVHVSGQVDGSRRTWMRERGAWVKDEDWLG